MKEQRGLGFGGNPRIVSDGTRAFEFITGTRFSDARMIPYDVSRDRRLTIKVDEPDFHFGKNWQAYLLGDELFAVHQPSPVRILKIDTDTGEARIVSHREVDFKLRGSYEPFPLFRGGSNALSLGKDVVGLGRTTANRVHHLPFFWSPDLDLHIDVVFTELFQPFVELGYGIIDPTSFFIENNDLYIGLACSERNWAHTQIMSDFLLVFPSVGWDCPHGRLSDYLATRQPVLRGGRPDMRRHMFLCPEMPQTRRFENTLGGVISDGEAGHMIYGPYAWFDTPGRYCVEFTYMTMSEQSGQIGVFKAVLTNDQRLG